ncbi:MAG TPA: L-fucose:H+ symporter permease [Terriglobales bacterium]|jgi:FHS family L-fucose permease-like MFS transporter|nr:L-fucose:H+ symporter permease [Terriglobales bacterium]
MSSPSQSVAVTSAPITERRFLVPFVLITSLFFLWAFGVNLNDILIPRFKLAFGLTDFQSSFIQVAFFGGYCLAAFPAGKLMERIGYKRGILLGLMLCTAGALLFLPAASIGLYAFFLVALFVMACGQSFLEVAANPYVTVLGPAASAERRLNFAQSFNAVGATISPLLGRALILTGVEYTPAQLALMSAAQVQAYRASQAGTVKLPYLLMAAIFVAVAAAIYFTHLPDVIEEADSSAAAQLHSGASVLSHPHLVKGVIAQFFYVGAQVGVASFVIRFAQHTLAGITQATAAYYLLGHQIGFMTGRFIGSALMKTIAPARMLSIFAIGCLVSVSVALLAHGVVPVCAVVLIGFFHSIMFPTIFALGIKNLGPLTKRGSSLMVMAIVGGGLFPPIMGRISDATNIQTAFIVPLICYVYILYFALAGYRPSGTSAIQQAVGAQRA